MRDLMNDAAQRKRLGKQMTTAGVLRAANDYLRQRLGERSQDVQAVSVRDAVLMIECLNSAAAHLINRESEQILNAVKEAVPRANVDRVRTRIVHSFKSNEV